MPPRLLVAVICLLTLTFALLSALAIVLGAQQPINPALAGFIVGCEDKPQPCWYGIMPGATTWEAAQVQLTQMGYSVSRFESRRVYYTSDHLTPPRIWISEYAEGLCKDDILMELLLAFYPDYLQIGHVIPVIGAPTAAVMGFDTSSRSRSLRFDRFFRIYLVSDWYTFNNYVSAISLSSRIEQLDSSRWHGFISHASYCRYEPDFLTCNG